jgi:cellulose synthase (UDP-forming)
MAEFRGKLETGRYIEEADTTQPGWQIKSETNELKNEYVRRQHRVADIDQVERTNIARVKSAASHLADTIQVGLESQLIPGHGENRVNNESAKTLTVEPPLKKSAVAKGETGLDEAYRIETDSALSISNKISLVTLTVLWLVANVWFWWWWVIDNVGNPTLYVLFTICSFYNVTILPGMYLFYLWNMRYPKKIEAQLAVDRGIVKEVAVISLTVPGSESLEHVARQMEAMQRIHFPHDTWILVDKCHSPEIKALASKYGVQYFSRHESEVWGDSTVKKWNQPFPPFQAKTKAGNVNAWLDAHGYRYSHFTQLDIDHNPKPNYLDKVLGYFVDQTVKWVQAPSVYRNFDSWTGRGSAEQEFVLQGPLQTGFFGFSKIPMIIGSHSTYDTKAIMEIGGFQPTRAEDHLDTLLLSACGYSGVYLPEVIAEGDGPETFETYLMQQFAWAYSIIQVLFGYSPRLLPTLGFKRFIQFIFVQTWYPFWSLSMLCLFVLPSLGLFSGQAISAVGYFDFIAHSLPLTLISFAMYRWSTKWHLPKGIRLSWRGIVLHVARWPVVLSALVQAIFKVKKPYMITPKGISLDRPISLAAYIPYLGLILINLATCWVYIANGGESRVQGYLLFALQGAFFMIVVLAVAILNEWHSLTRRLSVIQGTLLILRPLAFLLLTIVGLVTLTILATPRIIDSWVVNGNETSTAISRSVVTLIMKLIQTF